MNINRPDYLPKTIDASQIPPKKKVAINAFSGNIGFFPGPPEKTGTKKTEGFGAKKPRISVLLGGPHSDLGFFWGRPVEDETLRNIRVPH